MVVSRSPPPVRRSPRKTDNAAQSLLIASTSTMPQDTSETAPAAAFPSLDEMAAASREFREARSRSASSVSATSLLPDQKAPTPAPASTTTTVPSSLPRPVSKGMLTEPQGGNRVGRSSLTGTAMQRARQQAGDETPVSVSQARAARSAAANNGTDSPPQLSNGHKNALNPAIDPQSTQIRESTGAAADTGYDFDRYLEGDMDPFNRASRVNVRRDDSRPLPGLQDDPADDSGDTTARGVQTEASAPHTQTQAVKVASIATPVMSPHATPSMSSRKLAHFRNPPGGAGDVASGASADLAADMSKSRFEPSVRSDRLQSKESELMAKKHAAVVRELAEMREALTSAKEESEGWASECAGLQTQLATIQAAAAREQRTRVELQLRLAQLKSDVDDRTWKLHSRNQQSTHMQTELEYAKNEALSAESQALDLQSEWEWTKDDLRVRLMLERKRADLLALYYQREEESRMRLEEDLYESIEEVEMRDFEIEALNDELERVKAGKSSDDTAAKQTHQLERQVAQLNAEIYAMREKEDMMAETRKNWKIERKALQAEVALLKTQSTSKLASANTVPISAPERRPQPDYQPSSPIFGDKAKKQAGRKPMQGASEMEPPSDYTDPATSRIASNSRAADGPMAKAVSMSVKATLPKSKPAAKNWRDEVAITDSESEESDDAHRKPRRGAAKSIIPKKTSGAKPKAKPAATLGVEYDDQTADPSATPMIRNAGPKKRNLATHINDDDDEEDEHSVLASVLANKFGRDKTNVAGTNNRAKLVTEAPQPKKKKRKLLGGAGGPSSGWNGEMGEGLVPTFDIPLELSPIKGGASSTGGVRNLLSGFPGFGAATGRNGPFA